MLGKKTVLEKRIEELEEKGRYLEEKTKQALELLDALDTEFEDLQNMMLLGRQPAPLQSSSIGSQQTLRSASFVQNTLLPSPAFQPSMLDMTGSLEEEDALKDGWWPTEGSFRWAGKDNKDATVHFQVVPGRDYELGAKIFIPDALAGKQIKVFANDAHVADISSEKGTQVEKKIIIPKGIVIHDLLKVVFRSDFWKPMDIDPGLKDDRTLSIAFDYLSLK